MRVIWHLPAWVNLGAKGGLEVLVARASEVLHESKFDVRFSHEIKADNLGQTPTTHVYVNLLAMSTFVLLIKKLFTGRPSHIIGIPLWHDSWQQCGSQVSVKFFFRSLISHALRWLSNYLCKAHFCLSSYEAGKFRHAVICAGPKTPLIDMIENQAPSYKFSTAGRQVIYIGRIADNKGISLIQALADAEPDIKFTIFTPRSRTLDRSTVNINIRAGESDAALAEYLLSNSCVLLLPSLYESYGIVAEQALWAGCSVMASDQVMGAEVFRKSNRFFELPSHSVTQYREALSKVFFQKPTVVPLRFIEPNERIESKLKAYLLAPESR